MNEIYTAQSQAQKGFKTFILTLSVSLIIFSVIYYFISDSQTISEVEVVTDVTKTEVEATNNEDTVFGKLAATPVTATSRAVLAGSTTSPTAPGSTAPATGGVTAPVTPETTVPSTGVTSLTWGFFISIIAFILGFVVISKDPRSLAIQYFEKRMLKK